MSRSEFALILSRVPVFLIFKVLLVPAPSGKDETRSKNKNSEIDQKARANAVKYVAVFIFFVVAPLTLSYVASFPCERFNIASDVEQKNTFYNLIFNSEINPATRRRESGRCSESRAVRGDKTGMAGRVGAADAGGSSPTSAGFSV